jgi:hypothetical protein
MSAFNEKEGATMPTNSTIAPRETLRFTESLFTCRSCGAIDQARIVQGSGPHHAAAVCQHCGMHLQWLSAYTPAERAAKRQQARLEAMARKPPSQLQIAYLQALGHIGPTPANMLDASQSIDRLTGKGAHDALQRPH